MMALKYNTECYDITLIENRWEQMLWNIGIPRDSHVQYFINWLEFAVPASQVSVER